MATNTNLGGVFTTDLEKKKESNVFLSTENVVGLVFDTSVVGGLEAALGDGPTSKAFANGNVVEINTVKDVETLGLDETVLAGIVKYHLDCFFALAPGARRIFVSFMDSDTDPNFEAVEKMQLAAGGIIYQIGVWTSKPIATVQKDGPYVAEPGNICAKLQAVAETLGGTIGVTNFEGNAPCNIILSAPIVNAAKVDLTLLPDLNALELPKVSVLVGQGITDSIHEMMFTVNHVTDTPSYAPVGALGAILGCLAIAPANESIGHVANFNLTTILQEAELGFGNITENEGKTGYGDDSSFTNIKTIGYTKRNTYLHKKGFIFLNNYDNLENSIFFSGDQTLSSGDYRSLARCRVMHKSRRVVRRALLPRVNGNVAVDASTGCLSTAAIASFQNIVIQALDLNMVEPGTTVPQITGRSCAIDSTQNVLETDEVHIDYTLTPLGVSGAIHVTESFGSTKK